MDIRRQDKYPTERARRLRREQSPPEVVLWSRLRGRRLGGFRFRRQHPVDRFVADFACPEAMLVVELDSGWHAGRRNDDALRDGRMRELGWSVLRVTAAQLASNESQVLSRILNAAKAGRSRRDETMKEG